MIIVRPNASIFDREKDHISFPCCLNTLMNSPALSSTPYNPGIAPQGVQLTESQLRSMGKWDELKEKMKSGVDRVPEAARWAIGISLGITLIAAISKAAVGNEDRHPPEVIRSLKETVSSASKWATTAMQDQNPLVALMHVNYSIAHVQCARKIASDAFIERLCKVNPADLLAKLESHQHSLVQKITNSCPTVQPEGMTGGGSGWV